MWSRDEWIQKTKFKNTNNAEVLDLVLSQIKKTKEQGKTPYVLFDLDSTLFHVNARTLKILQEWVEHPETEAFHETRKVFSDVGLKDIRYSLQDLFEAKNLDHKTGAHSSAFFHVKNFWGKRFFNSSYVRHDILMPGAKDFVHQVFESGANIVYLTGRDVPQMSFGTFDQLKDHGFPLHDPIRTRLILKPKKHLDDASFKSEIAKKVSGWGEIVANFENEPKNLVAMAKEIPNAINVFIESNCSDHSAPEGENLYKITHFLR